MGEVEVPDPHELEEHATSSFSRRVAITTAIYAVVLAIASLGGNYAMKEMLLAQQQSSDQWAFYQAKVMREHLYRAQKMLAESMRAGGAADVARTFADEERRYNAEKKEIETEARKLEQLRDRYRTRDPYFDYAEVFLQIAIVTASVSILATSRALYVFSLVIAVIGVLYTVDGYTLTLHLPLLHGAH
jgi:Domain of unknown function (DUF4337)